MQPGIGPLLRNTVSPPFTRATLGPTLKTMFKPREVPERMLGEFPLALISRPEQLRAISEDGAAIAAEEKLIAEEARALAQQRGWPTNLAGAAYGWTRLAKETAREALPRIIRIYDRECFELDADARERSGDEEVGSLVLGALDGRRSIYRALSALDAQATLPGAK